MKFGFLIFDGLEELDLIGPWEMMTVWGAYVDGPQCLMVAEKEEPVTCAKGLSINPHVTFDTCPDLDYLLIPGGRGTRVEAKNPVLVDFVKRTASNARAVLSVCTGSFILEAAGLLADKPATTHWGSLDHLRQKGVQVSEERYVRADNIWSAAGVSAGIDLALAFIASETDDATAGKVQSYAEYYPDGAIYGDFQTTDEAPAYLKTG